MDERGRVLTKACNPCIVRSDACGGSLASASIVSEDPRLPPAPSVSPPDESAASSVPPSSTPVGRGWFSATHLGISAGLISAIAALITALVSVPWLSGGDTTSETTTTGQAEPAELTRLLLEDPLTSQNALQDYRSARCSVRYDDEHLLIEVHVRFLFCGSDTAGFGLVSVLPTARVEIDYRFTTLPNTSYRGYGPGSVQLRCRGTGAPNVATAIYAWLSPLGWWGIDRFRTGDSTPLVERRAPGETTQRGEVRRFRLDCVQLEDGAVEAIVYVDDTKLGTTLVAKPPPPGDVGVAVNAFTAKPIEAAFSRLRVYGPERR